MGEMPERQKRAMDRASSHEEAPRGQRPAAGWYPHPSMVDTQQYWNGQAWTDHIAPGKPAAHTTQVGVPEPETMGLQVAGAVSAILLPIVGFIIGFILIGKSKTGPGLGCIVLSIIAFMVWYSVLTPDPTYNDLYYGDTYP